MQDICSYNISKMLCSTENNYFEVLSDSNIINHKHVGNIEVAVKPKTGAIVVQVGACPAFIEQLQGL